MSDGGSPQPKVSVVILNYNGQDWLPRCLKSLEAQTVYPEIEVIVVDNNSPDGSARLAVEWVKHAGKGRVVQNQVNLYFCEANNVGARAAAGDYLFFLNHDAWLEPDCLERLLREMQAANADAATPIVLNYEDDTYQSLGGPGFDLFGVPVGFSCRFLDTKAIFAACGCSFFVKADMFRKVGGFDSGLLMYVDETDLSWRVQIAGGKVIGVPSARVHHRGAVTANPEGKTRLVESRTSDTKRFLANRNGILLILKNAQHLLLLLLLTHLLLLFLESLAALVLVRRWSHVRKCYWGAVFAAFGMARHVREWRRRIRTFRRRSDFSMLKFIRFKPGRWEEFVRLFVQGAPKVDEK